MQTNIVTCTRACGQCTDDPQPSSRVPDAASEKVRGLCSGALVHMYNVSMFRPRCQYASCIVLRRSGMSNTKSSSVKSRCKTRQLPTYARVNGSSALRQDTLHIVVAGGGLGGLYLAICLMKKGFYVTVIERTAEYRNFGGPIQLASNGMSVLKATSRRLYESVQQNSRPFWGTKSGIKYGYTGDWMFTFDAITEIPKRMELPFAVCIDRSDLQYCLLNEIRSLNLEDSCGQTEIIMDATVTSYHQDSRTGKVRANLEHGTHVEGDVLIGADGIWSTVRSQMFDEQNGRGSKSTASYTGYKLFSSLPLYQTDDFFEIGYCAYIGPDNYFVTCPDRHGRIQWYAFVKSSPESDYVEDSKSFLLQKFERWTPEVRALLAQSENIDISQRDLWDRPPCLRSWSNGRVALLGDSCHATMPNIGQGSGLAFEDAFVLSNLLGEVKHPHDIGGALNKYYAQRIWRTATIQGLGRMNSEAIKILTPLLPIKSLIDFVISPFLPLVFIAQFGYCYSFCPEKEAAVTSISSAARMNKRHIEECMESWHQ